MAAAGYDPSKTEASTKGIAEFVGSEIVEDITSVPGVGPAAKTALAAAGVTTTYQLVGKFLQCRGEGSTTRQHCDAFYFWLKDAGITGGWPHAITRAIAQQCHAWMDGIYNEAEL
mmetsp:Transcript_12071/g.28759  ORF Transcript_12071/g.28759 Transcript_12071/m.28759 type:complete len:115 (+) Transcript_12071:244-588(+)